MANAKRMLLVLLVMACGLIVGLWHPVWLAPPLFYYTDVAYAIFGLAWLPLLVVIAKKYPLYPSADYRLAIIVIAFGGMLLLLFGLTLLGGIAEATNPETSCKRNNESQATIRYTCSFAGSSDAGSGEFEGIDGLPIVWLASN